MRFSSPTLALAVLLVAAPANAEDAADTRTLDAITIEGEVSLPSVLFINARDQRRDIGFLYAEYAEEREAETLLPTWVMYGPIGLFNPVPTLLWTTPILETNEIDNQPAVPAEDLRRLVAGHLDEGGIDVDERVVLLTGVADCQPVAGRRERPLQERGVQGVEVVSRHR